MPDRPTVAIVQSDATEYPSRAPFSPSVAYPELGRFSALGTDEDGRVYAAVRRALEELRLDEANLGTAAWSPFRGLVVPGNKVVIKPNLVLHHHRRGETVLSIIVHASVLRPILDYVQIALEEKARSRAWRTERIWDSINGPNLDRNIMPTRAHATLVLRKDADHSVRDVRLRKL